MSHRRTFLGQMAAVAGAAGFGSLLTAQRLFADELRSFRSARSGDAPFAALRERYLLDPDVIYFNHASIGTIPRAVHEAHVRYLGACETNPWLHMWGGEWEEPRARVRALAAGLLGCDSGETVLTHNTTEGFNVLANGLRLGPGDEVVFSSLNHDGASVCWFHAAAARGFSVKRFAFPVLDVPRMTEDDLLNVYDQHIGRRTRVLVFPHIDNIVGLRYPVKRLAALAKGKGVDLVAVDGAQAVGMIDVNVHDLGVDVYCASPHKWLQAPKGLGLMVIHRDRQDEVRPMWVTWGQERWKGTPRIFEDYGTRNLPELLALGDAIEFQQTLGVGAKEARYRELWDRFRTAAAAAGNVVWRSPESWPLATSLYALEIEGKDSRDVFTEMNPQGFVFRAFRTQGLNTIRISPNVFADDAEIQRFFDVVKGMAPLAR